MNKQYKIPIKAYSHAHTHKNIRIYIKQNTYCIAAKFSGGELTLFKHLAKKVCRINRSANRLLIVSTNLDDFSLANYE